MKALLYTIISLLSLLAASVDSFGEIQDSTQIISWKRHSIDASRTGVTIPSTTNIKEALGTVDENGYHAPNGKIYKGGSTEEVAKLMLDAQKAMAPVKEIIGFSSREMVRQKPQCELSNWFIDFLIATTAEMTGKQVDVGISNFGGIRTDMPEGDISIDDILSMFPFKNTICYVNLKGSDLRRIFEYMADTGIQVVGGVKLTLQDKKLASIMIGDKLLDDRKTYGVATISFLLNGGDGLSLARNALELVDTGVLIRDAVIPYVKKLTAEGKAIEYQKDDRITILDSQENEK